jgi:hypothetical protein
LLFASSIGIAGHVAVVDPIERGAGKTAGELIDHIFASHRLVNPDNIPAVQIVAASPLPSMADDPTLQTSAPSDHAAIVATFSV